MKEKFLSLMCPCCWNWDSEKNCCHIQYGYTCSFKQRLIDKLNQIEL